MCLDAIQERRLERCAHCTGEWAVRGDGALRCSYEALCALRGAPLPACIELDRCPMDEEEQR